MKIIVTGASGFIGAVVVSQLASAGHEVVAVSRRPLSATSSVTVRQFDLLADDPKPLFDSATPAVLVHLAWYAVPGKFWSASENVLWVESSLRLARRFLECGGKHIVVAGTCAEYEWGNSELLDETHTPCRPVTLYGAAKHGLHTVLRPLVKIHDATLAWARIFFPYGEGEPDGKFITGLVRSLLAGKAAEISEGSQLRDYIHVDDVSTALKSLALQNWSGTTNICSGTAVRVRDIASRVGEMLGRRDLILFGARPRPEGDPDTIVGSVKVLHENLKIQPQLTLDDGLRRIIDYRFKHSR